MKKVFLIALTLILAASVSAQENGCAVKLAELPQSPEFRGFYLRMSAEQVKKLIPQVILGRADEFGLARTSINPYFHPRIDKTNLEDVRTISLDFLDGQLTSLWIGYEGTFKWSKVDDFVKGISGSLQLPGAWARWRDRGQQLQCADFKIIVTMIGGGVSFRIVDIAAEDQLAMRRQAKEEN